LSNNQIFSNSNPNQNTNNPSNHNPTLMPFAASASIALPNTNINIPLQQRIFQHLNANLNPPPYNNSQQPNQQPMNSLTRLNNLISQHQQQQLQHQQQQLHQQLSLLNNMHSIVSFPINGREQIGITSRLRLPRIHYLDRSIEVE
jgi:hypothetical protein